MTSSSQPVHAAARAGDADSGAPQTPAPQASAPQASAPQRIAIIGGGIAGLAAAYDLTRGPSAAQVTVYEAAPQLGGLAAGYKGRAEWEWPLEHFYHHLFTNDDAILDLVQEVGLNHLVEIHRPTTVMHTHGENHPFDSALRLMRFPYLNFFEKLRMGMVIAFLKYMPAGLWRRYDRILADAWLGKWMGKRGYETVWQPMMQGKFGPYYDKVNLAWFWARIYKRTPRLAYFSGGFQAFVEGLADTVRRQGAHIITGTQVQQIRRQENGWTVEASGVAPTFYDSVISTTSPGLMQRLAPELPDSYLAQLKALTSIGAVVLTVALDRRLMKDVYWVNMPKRDGYPFLALVEHTNMIDASHYAGDHLLYLGDYLPPDHRYFDLSAEELVTEFTPWLKRFNADFNPEWITGAWVHKAKYAQPVPPVGYADMIPEIRTPLPGLYFASMSQVYPWDRGTNYAVEIGRKVAGMVQQDQAKRLSK